MKLLSTILIALSVVLGAMADGTALAVKHQHNYLIAEGMPLDQVILAPEEVIRPGEFYPEPVAHPPNVPPTCVLVMVFQNDGVIDAFVGYVWMEAELVNYLHGIALPEDTSQRWAL